MAGSLSDYQELLSLDALFGGGSPATLYLALFTARGTDAQSDANTNWTEVTGGSYARKAVTNNSTNFPAASGVTATKSLNVAQTFATPSANWGTVTALGIYDASTAGNLIGWCDLAASQTINTGNTVTVAVGALTITLD